jgi:hypothetical protein
MLLASMIGYYSTRASLTLSYFLCRTDLLGNLFLITSLLDLLAILPATMLGYYSMSVSLMPSEFFHRRFDLL